MISFCIIGKNEEAIIEKCLVALVPYGYEIVYVDTGSSDRTKEIAHKYTDRIYDFEWINDFSAARNFAISKASGDYILMIDCDEIVTEFDQAETDHCLRKSTGYTRMILIFYINWVRRIIWSTNMNWRVSMCGRQNKKTNTSKLLFKSIGLLLCVIN